jgi:lipoprotein-anchoring transpeptidase ErfK/SrfK
MSRSAAVALVTALAAGLATGCLATGERGADQAPPPGSQVPVPGNGGEPVPSESSSPQPVLDPSDGMIPFDEPLRVAVRDGKLIGATVTDAASGAPLPGTLTERTWVSASWPLPGVAYQVSASVLDNDGDTHRLQASLQTAKVPDGRRLTLSIFPTRSMSVGVGQPIVIRLDQRVTDRAAFEKAATVRASTPLIGSWHWVSSREVHFRPQKFWPARTTVDLNLKLNGVKVGDDLWGGRSYATRFSIGDARAAVVNAKKHTFTVSVNGKRQASWPTSLGKPEFATRNGTYVVLEKTPKLRMTSCSAGIQCTPGGPNWYDLEVKWDVRLTWSGTFVHSAPWSTSSQGRSNVSHGCLNLSDAHGRAFYSTARPGDIVTVVGSTRDASDLVSKGDPGMADWNMSWAQYVAGSATGQPVAITALTA